jgi:hypothetical protein
MSIYELDTPNDVLPRQRARKPLPSALASKDVLVEAAWPSQAVEDQQPLFAEFSHVPLSLQDLLF